MNDFIKDYLNGMDEGFNTTCLRFPESRNVKKQNNQQELDDIK